MTEQDGSHYRSWLFPCDERLVSDCAVDGLDGILGNDEAVAHSLRVSIFVFTRQRVGEIATILNHPFSCGD